MNPLYIISDPISQSEVPHPVLAPFISHYEFHDEYHPNDEAFEKKLCFQPETSMDFIIGDDFKKSKGNAGKLILKTRAIIRTPIACKNCMPEFSGHFISFSIKFHPTGLHRLLGIAMDKLGNNSIPVSEISLFPVEEIIDKMMYASSIGHCIRTVEPYLLSLAMNYRPAAGLTEQAAREIIQEKGMISVSELASHSCISVSQLEKNFNRKVGVSPKVYASMQRLFSLLCDKTKNREDKWSALAYKYDYHDPIHFTREFNKYFSLNPTTFNSLNYTIL